MQKWQINGSVQWLCNECAKANAHVFILYPHQWLAEDKDTSMACDCCRCSDSIVRKMGRMRWLLYPVLCLIPKPWPATAKVARRFK